MSKRLRLSLMKDYPFMNPNCTLHFRIGSTCENRGLAIEIVHLIANYLNLTVDVVRVSEYVPGWTNTFNEVYENKTDTYGLFYGERNSDFMAKYDYTKPILWKSESTPFSGSDFPQLLKDRRLRLVIERKAVTWFLNELNSSNEFPYYEIREALKVNPFDVVDNALEAISKESDTATVYVEHWLYKNPNKVYCNLELIDAFFQPRPQRFMFKKGNKLVEMFDEAIAVNVYQIKRIVRKYMKFHTISECSCEETGAMRLSVVPYYGSLFLFLIGIAIACCVFFKEMFQKINSQ
ncbi:hypothetical protein M3Y95_00410100 [Aphelenchoides besseyi]|nr:hypothetical protein M3Y95_00410100 [Aphelenchoides besseyi]